MLVWERHERNNKWKDKLFEYTKESNSRQENLTLHTNICKMNIQFNNHYILLYQYASANLKLRVAEKQLNVNQICDKQKSIRCTLVSSSHTSNHEAASIFFHATIIVTWWFC